jgi:DeoR/GlpR family transcriptional regulator of sugar metabolism
MGEIQSNLAYNCDFYDNCRVLLHGAKLRHGTDGFTSPRKEGILRNFRPKNLTASAGCEIAKFGTRGQHANH